MMVHSISSPPKEKVNVKAISVEKGNGGKEVDLMVTAVFVGNMGIVLETVIRTQITCRMEEKGKVWERAKRDGTRIREEAVDGVRIIREEAEAKDGITEKDHMAKAGARRGKARE